jgi:hypothetical protein
MSLVDGHAVTDLSQICSSSKASYGWLEHVPQVGSTTARTRLGKSAIEKKIGIHGNEGGGLNLAVKQQSSQ